MAGYKRLERELDDAVTLIELGESEDDDASIEEGEGGPSEVGRGGATPGVEALLSGEAERQRHLRRGHAGAAAPQSQDWAEMLQPPCTPALRPR